MQSSAQKTIELGHGDFNDLRKIVLANTGISLSSSKMELVKRRFTPRLKALGLDDFGAYVNYLQENFTVEGVHFCNAITTNLTSFFRESHHFDLLRDSILPTLFPAGARPARVRIWSAGCSTGQEAYCLAMTLREHVPQLARHDVRILATDLDGNCLATARAGTYPEREFERMPAGLLDKYFTQAAGSGKYPGQPHYRASDELKSMIAFNRLNLMEPWPMKGGFDLIFCRNVFIYFDKPTQVQILKRFAALQKPGAHICLGHSEIIPAPADIGYQMVGKTTYIRLPG